MVPTPQIHPAVDEAAREARGYQSFFTAYYCTISQFVNSSAADIRHGGPIVGAI
jgi:hypothetical protein